MILGGILYLAAPLAFDAALPKHPIPYFASLALLIAVTLSLGCVLGLAVKNQSKLTMICQLFFLPSILLSGILVPVELLPSPLSQLGMLFPAYWGYRLMQEGWVRLGKPLAFIDNIAGGRIGVRRPSSADTEKVMFPTNQMPRMVKKPSGALLYFCCKV